MSLPTAIISTVVAAMVSCLGVELVRRWAWRHQVVDIPNERSSHRVPVPRGGGVAVVAASIAGIIALEMFASQVSLRGVAILLATATAIALISWIDDLRGLPASLRFAIHLLAAAIVVSAFGYVDAVAISHRIVLRLGVLGIPLTLVWIVGLTNAYNFMDGIDGIAATQAVVAAVGWMCIVGPNGGLTFAVAVVVLGAVIGFLPYNWHPARIFMGDVCSAFLGFTFAVLPLTTASADESFVPAVMLVWPFVFDTGLTLLRRILKRERLASAHRSHLYQRLTQAGLSHATVAAIYGALAACGVGAALLERAGGGILAIVIIATLAFVLWAGTIAMERRRWTVIPESGQAPLPHSADLP